MPDLVAESSYLVQGQPFWDEPQLSFFQVPLIQSVYNALEEAYAAERGLDQASLDWAQQFGLEKVWADYWLPFLRDYFGARQ